MKKSALFIIVISIVTLISLVLYKFGSLKVGNKTIDTSKTSRSQMPLFEFETLDGAIFSKYNLDKKRSTIIIYFDPECGLCERPAKICYKFQKIFKDSQVLFVSSSTVKKMQIYIKKFNLNKISNVNFYIVDFDTFYKLFNESRTPTYFIYNAKQKHIKTINDEIPVKILARYIKAAQQNE